jgi:CBS domain-containing protein
VVDHAGHLVGIISRVDVLAVFGRSDTDTSEEVARTVLPGVVPTATGKLHVDVRDGIVISPAVRRARRPHGPMSRPCGMSGG